MHVALWCSSCTLALNEETNLLVDFVEHHGVIVLLRVVMETDHAIFLVNTCINLSILDLRDERGKI